MLLRNSNQSFGQFFGRRLWMRGFRVGGLGLNYLTPLLAAGGAAVVIAAAPTAAAATAVPAPPAAASQQSCSYVGGGNQCQTPGNVQINDSPPAVADNGYCGGGAYPGPYPVPFGEG
jgi:hypothetical protein